MCKNIEYNGTIIGVLTSENSVKFLDTTEAKVIKKLLSFSGHVSISSRKIGDLRDNNLIVNIKPIDMKNLQEEEKLEDKLSEKLNRSRNHKEIYEDINDLHKLLNNINELDYFIFRYNEKEIEKRFEPYHCFDGKMTVRKVGDEWYLVDGYWSGDNVRKTIKQALDEGSLKFICNLNDVEKIDKYKLDYYIDEDIVNLTSQKGYNGHYSIFKDAERNKEKMIKILKHKISNAEHNIQSSNREIVVAEEKIEEINNGKNINDVWL